MGQVSVDLAGALAVNSTLTYTSAQRKWFDFCKRAGVPPILHRSVVPDPLEAELIVMMFCSFCRLEGVDGDSVSTYVSGVRSLHIDAIGVAPWEPGHRLKRLRRSLRKEKKRRGGVEKRAPITRQILMLWRRWFDLSKPQHVIWWTAMLVAFFGLFRKSEFTVPDGVAFNPLFHLTRADVSFQRDDRGRLISIELHVKFYKNEQFGSTTAVPLSFTGDILCAATMVERLYNLFSHLPPTAPLFPGGANFREVLRGGEFAQVVDRFVKATPALAGVKMLPHSFRIGGAMALFEAGAPDSVIMMMGRWKSNAFLAYLRTSRSLILYWNQKVAEGSVSTGSRVLGVDQAEAVLSALRIQTEFAFTAASPVLGVVSGRGATVVSSVAVRACPLTRFPHS
jgi:hypothetical protein